MMLDENFEETLFQTILIIAFLLILFDLAS